VAAQASSSGWRPEQGGTDLFERVNWDRLIGLGIEHITAVLIAIALAAVVGVSLGVLTYRSKAGAEMVTAVCATILTIPSFALFGLMLPIFGLGETGPILALIAYALLPIVRNTITGLQGVDPAIVEAAKGMGMPSRARLLRIELPLAWPVILTGLRVATLLITSIYAIAAYMGAGGLGNDIFRALSNVGAVWALDVAVTATVAIVVVAIILDSFYLLLGKLTTPRGIRN